MKTILDSNIENGESQIQLSKKIPDDETIRYPIIKPIQYKN